MNELSAMAVETGQWHLHPVLNIHDDLTFVIPDNDDILEEAITTIYKVMLTPPYKEVNVPLSVKASVGPAWYGMQEIGKFWSHTRMYEHDMGSYAMLRCLYGHGLVILVCCIVQVRQICSKNRGMITMINKN